MSCTIYTGVDWCNNYILVENFFRKLFDIFVEWPWRNLWFTLNSLQTSLTRNAYLVLFIRLDRALSFHPSSILKSRKYCMEAGGLRRAELSRSYQNTEVVTWRSLSVALRTNARHAGIGGVCRISVELLGCGPSYQNCGNCHCTPW